MSRTFRRKRGKYHYEWVLRDYRVVESTHGWYIQDFQIERHSESGRRKIARFHSDAGFGDYRWKSAPHWYRRLCNKKFARADQRLVHGFIRGESEDVVASPRARNASWYW